ncbi:MAG: ATP-binding cassette domain-containing protein [Planctomycetes bacterium]|nr:ATP-binding cassette domain-containing protein [Planctomycetota bacterium]
MIEVENLTKYFGPIMAIDRISFKVGQGEIVGFLGLNGAGKTTTMRILTSYLPATSGIARIAGFDVMLESTEVRKNIGYLPESVPLYPEMRVDEYLDFRAKLKGVPRSERNERLGFCLERCRLVTVRRRLIGTLSKGYRQRVGLADAMIHNPAILILDEPTAGLDPAQIRETLALLRELGESHTILLSTHILTEVEAICERVIIISSGRIGLDKYLDDIESENVILLEVRGPSDKVINTVKGLGAVLAIQTHPVEDGVTKIDVRTADDKDIREEISHAMASKGWAIRRLERKGRSLADAFFEILRVDDPLKDAPAAAETKPAPAPAPTTDTTTTPSEKEAIQP